MAREKKPKEAPGDPAWLVTFSDLVTLLLTFFVLILSMSSMDKSVLTRVNLLTSDIGFVTKRSAGKIPQRIELLLQLLENPIDVVKKPNRFKDLLFADVLPQEIDRSTLYENIEVMRHPEGLAIVLSDKLAFARNSKELTELAQRVLWAVMEMLQYSGADVNLAGYTGIDEGNGRPFVLSGERALAVLHFFVQNGIEQRRFSISAYGPNFALADSDTGTEQAQNRRVSILIKSTPLFAGYQTR